MQKWFLWIDLKYIIVACQHGFNLIRSCHLNDDFVGDDDDEDDGPNYLQPVTF